jgi:tRNA(fMet)-specific endonuclease VapC
MEQGKIVLCDTDVIIEFYKNNPAVISELKKIGQQNVAICTITAGELFYGARNKKELNQIKKDLNSLRRIDIDKNISELFLKLISTYA